MNLVLTILAVSELEVAAAFYRAAFGWPLRVEAPVYREFELPGGGRFGLYQQEGYERNLQHPVASVRSAELYFSCADPASEAERLLALGARLVSPLAPRPWGDEVVYLADPDGYVLALARENRSSSPPEREAG